VFGNNDFGQLSFDGDFNTISFSKPKPVKYPPVFIVEDIYCGKRFTLIKMFDGLVHFYGDNSLLPKQQKNHRYIPLQKDKFYKLTPGILKVIVGCVTPFVVGAGAGAGLGLGIICFGQNMKLAKIFFTISAVLLSIDFFVCALFNKKKTLHSENIQHVFDDGITTTK
jgi:hypothetical protein